MSEFADRLLTLVSPYLELSAGQLSALERHYQLLLKWNARINLTAIRSLEEAIERHYAECLWFAGELRRHCATAFHHQQPTVVDVGSGGGFPGIPIAVYAPVWNVTLVESHRRKAVFLAEAARGMPNVRVLSDRAENIHQTFDVAVSRAVNPATVLKLPLAASFGLLIGAGDVPRGTSAQVLPVPWGQKRVAMFHVEPAAR
jgi:16S rRNA (guanine527-N7)-methyltransferase